MQIISFNETHQISQCTIENEDAVNRKANAQNGEMAEIDKENQVNF